MNKSIGFVLTNTPNYSETFLVSKINGLAKAGFHVTIFAKRNVSDLSYLQEGVKVVEPKAMSSNLMMQSLRTIFALIKLFLFHPFVSVRFVKYEVKDKLSASCIIKELYLNAHILPYKLNWLYFAFATNAVHHENAAAAVGAKFAISFRGFDIATYPLEHPGCLSRIFAKVDKVHTISDDLYKKALDLGLSPDKTVVKITPAIDTSVFCQKRKLKTETPLKIVTVGRLTWKKGLDYAMQALSMLEIPFSYTLVGDGEDLERLQYAAYQHGIRDKVIFAGRQPHDMIVSYLQEASIYLQPSVQEGFCNAVLEAQAMGLICVVSDAEGLPENVENGKSGIVVPRRDSAALKDAIIRIVSMSEDEKQQMSDYAVERVMRLFDITDQIEKFIEFYS